MALFSEARSEQTKRTQFLSQITQQVLLVPESAVLAGLLLIAWAFNWPPIAGILAILTVLAFGLRVGLLALAEQYLARGAYLRADRLARAALRLNPWSSDALLLRAQGLTHQGDDEAAEQLLRRAATLYPNDQALQHALAGTILAQGRLNEGWQIANSDQQTNALSPEIVQQRAWLALHVENDAGKARRLIQRLDLSRYPACLVLPLLTTLCEAQIALGVRDEAQRTLLTLEAQITECPVPQQAELMYHLGKLHTALGKESASYFRRCVELDPNGRYAQGAWRSAVNG